MSKRYMWIIILFLLSAAVFLLYRSQNSQEKLLNSGVAENKNINMLEDSQKIQEGKMLLIDVRNQSEWDAGVSPYATKISLPELESRVSELEGYKDKEVVVVCRSGGRASQAVTILKKHGFTNVKNGGAWENYK